MICRLRNRVFACVYSGSASLGLALIFLLSPPVSADEFVSASAPSECRPIEVDAERLLCYDTVADGGVYNRQRLEEVQKEKFGSKESSSEISVDEIEVTIVKIQKSASGKYYFHIDDGSVWKQSGRGKWNMAVPLQANLKAGALGSFFLVTEGGKSTRVKRVR